MCLRYILNKVLFTWCRIMHHPSTLWSICVGMNEKYCEGLCVIFRLISSFGVVRDLIDDVTLSLIAVDASSPVTLTSNWSVVSSARTDRWWKCMQTRAAYLKYFVSCRHRWLNAVSSHVYPAAAAAAILSTSTTSAYDDCRCCTARNAAPRQSQSHRLLLLYRIGPVLALGNCHLSNLSNF